MEVANVIATPNTHPDLCYNKLLTDWREFVKRSPEKYERWIYAVGREAAEFEVAHLLTLPKDRKVIVDINIPLDLLRELSDYHHIAVMLSPLSMIVEHSLTALIPTSNFY